MSAIISDCGKYRYRLERTVALQGITVAWFGINPSTANGDMDDATIRKMVGFSRKLGAKTMIVGNCIPFRATDVSKIGKCSEEAMLLNYHHCAEIIRDSAVVIPCWGAIRKVAPHLRGAVVVTKMQIVESHTQVLCLGTTKCGNPKHPLMLGYNTPFERLR